VYSSGVLIRWLKLSEAIPSKTTIGELTSYIANCYKLNPKDVYILYLGQIADNKVILNDLSTVGSPDRYGRRYTIGLAEWTFAPYHLRFDRYKTLAQRMREAEKSESCCVLM
jgi:hypothetical protein